MFPSDTAAALVDVVTGVAGAVASTPRECFGLRQAAVTLVGALSWERSLVFSQIGRVAAAIHARDGAAFVSTMHIAIAAVERPDHGA